MQGQVLEGSSAGGLILGADGSRYRFGPGEWRAGGVPEAGMSVDFVAVGEAARDVYRLPLQKPPPGPAAAAGAPEGAGNSVLLGVIGIACLVLGFAIPLVPLVAALVLGLVGATNAKQYGNATGLVLSRVAWIGAVVLMLAGAAFVAWGFSIVQPILERVMEFVAEQMRQGRQV